MSDVPGEPALPEPGLDHDYPPELFTDDRLTENRRWTDAHRQRSSSPVDVTIRAAGHGPNGPVTRVVMHRMEAPLKIGTAVAVARYFAAGAGGRGVAAHYSVDPGTTVLSVPDEELCYHAPPNAHSIGIEQAGYCANNDWNSPAGLEMLHRSAALAADLCGRHGLPKVWLSAADLRAGRRGITSHHQVSLAWRQTSHTDPDPYFPLAYFMSLVTGPGPAPQPQPPPGPVVFGPVTVTDYPEDHMRKLTFTLPLDDTGCGWRDIDTSPAGVVSFVVNAANPPDGGYGRGVDVSRLDFAGKTRVVVANGPPKGTIGLDMWVAG